MSAVPLLPPLVARAVPRLARALAVDRILLFGSYAKGAARDGSDVDLLVVVDAEEITADVAAACAATDGGLLSAR